MTRSSIHVLLQLSILPELREEAEAMALRYAAEVRSQPGCERVEVLQDETDPGAFVVLQEWESAEEMDRNFQRQEFAEAVRRVMAALAAPPAMRTYRRIT